MSAQSGSGKHAAAFLRSTDRDRYLASLVLPEDARAPVQALHAFNADVASIRERVIEPALGEMRLQWWVDAIRGAGQGIPDQGAAARQNPLADALLSTIEGYRLPTPALERLLSARRFDLYDDPMPDLTTFEGYAGETVSVLYQLAAMILNAGREVEGGDAAGHLGVAHALIGHLRAFGLNASRGRLFLPLSVFSENGVHESEIFSGTVSEGLLAAHQQLVEMAADHLRRATVAIGSLPQSLRPAFAMIALLRFQLDRVLAQSETPYAPPHEVADWRRIAILVVGAWRRG